MATDLPTFDQRRLLVGIALLSAGLWLFIGFLALPAFLMAIPFAGVLIVLPLVWLLGDDFPLVESTDGETESTPSDPVESLQHRYSTGRIDEAEFERRLDSLLEEDEGGGRRTDPSTDDHTREPELNDER